MDPRLRSFFFGDEHTSPFLSLLPPSFADAQVDWIETSDAHIFKANLPGLKKDDVQVQIQEGNVLQISGEYKKPDDKGPVKWHNVERTQGRFARRFQLPDNIRVEDVKAHEQDGVLTVIIPKKQDMKLVVRKVPITSKL